jgi:hypothetical protein
MLIIARRNRRNRALYLQYGVVLATYNSNEGMHTR